MLFRSIFIPMGSIISVAFHLEDRCPLTRKFPRIAIGGMLALSMTVKPRIIRSNTAQSDEMQWCAFYKSFAQKLCFCRVFLLILSVFNAFSASEFTLVFGIPCFLAVGFITIFLSAIPSDKEGTAVSAAYHNVFRAVLGLPFIFRCRVFRDHSRQREPCYIKIGRAHV